MDKGKKPSKHLRESRETVSSCTSKMIRAQAALDLFILAMEEKSDKMTEKEEKEVELEIEKMKNTLEIYLKTAQRFEVTWLRNNPGTCRTKKGRQDVPNKDSGFISVDSSVIPPDRSEPSPIIEQETRDPDEKQISDTYDISLRGPISRPPSEHDDMNLMLHKGNPTDSLPADNGNQENTEATETAVEQDTDKNEKSDEEKNDLDKSGKESPKDDQAKSRAQRSDAGTSEQAPDSAPTRCSTAFAASLDEDTNFLQIQGEHQRKRFGNPKNKSNSL